ncbi:uncharacterized protein LOC110994572 [Pieris rapae]|uniref:uncharacterized protein LOC110994572 n=1 Tax=Pieris rapae TaxID=64459 RepID=UPI001E27C467|nr:uncharacterized protein LOC110994572 [Pieris rapae]
MGSIISHLLHFSENIFVCITCSSLVTCLVFTIAMTLLLGIGLGYNYGFIDFKTKNRYVPTRYKYKYQSNPYWQAGNDDEYYDKETNESHPINAESEANSTVRLNYNSNDTRIPQPDNLNESLRNKSVFEFMSVIRQGNELIQPEEKSKAIKKNYNITDVIQNSKIVIPMSDLDLISLLSKWRVENRNYSLQVVVS